MAKAGRAADGGGREGLGGAVEATAIERMERNGLLDLWPKVMGTRTPRGMSQNMMRRFLAYEVQAQALGGLGKAEFAEIARLGAGSVRAKAVEMAPGSRFLREWNGVTHVVERNETGYIWNGEVHTSLSAIAKAITGVHWSGPRFFGVKAAKVTVRRLSADAGSPLSAAKARRR